MAQWEDGVGKRCVERGCNVCPHCDHPWWIKVQWKGDRKSGYGPVGNFLFLWRDHPKPPTTRKEAVILAGRVLTWLQQGKPMPEVKSEEKPDERVGNDLIDGWLKFRATKRKPLVNPGSISAFESKVRITREFFGEKTLKELEAEALLTEFIETYDDAGCLRGTPNAILATCLRPAMRWGAAQRVPWVSYVPFGVHRFDLNRTAEGHRDTRCTPHTEAHLLDAFGILNDQAYQFCGGYMADFTIGMIDLGPRPFELLSLTNGDVDWHAHRVTFRNTKYEGENRTMPFNPDGRFRRVLERRRFAGPKAPVIADHEGNPVVKLWKGWVHGVCIAHDLPYELLGASGGGYPTPETMAGYKAVKLVPYSLRHEFATWVGLCGMPDDDAEFLQGHKRQKTHARYKHEALLRTTNVLREKVWPREGERAQLDPALEAERLARQRKRA